ncbi:Rho-GAP domain-containing protein [Salix suchowensis]|nr:Rho-GAP domain-containing protein [Salix suchowensis]
MASTRPRGSEVRKARCRGRGGSIFRRVGVSSSVLEDLESKRVPALVVRCAQHLLIWGVQEEGLFRVNGRPSHVSKLRSEFDSGTDYDMTNCNPGDLDPHAVASVFKAYLRECKPSSTQASGIHAVRKPPSLSTLAMPSFAGMRPPSESLLNALRSLIAQLPSENRDLLRIVTDLINATAKESKATKMPLSNLLLVFCPSLNMSPPLLRVLCEATSIWEPHVEPEVLDIRRESVIIDIKSPAADDDGKEKVDQNEQPDASTERLPQSVDTVYMDASDHISIANSSVTYSSDASSRDDVSYVSTSEGVIPRQLPPSPPLSSSVESLSTPSTSTDDRSFDDEHDLYLKRPSRGSPVIADSNSSSPLSTSPGRPTISRPILTAKPPTINSPLNLNSPIQFPLTTSIPPTPVSAVRKRSFPSLSLPSFVLSTDLLLHHLLPHHRRYKRRRPVGSGSLPFVSLCLIGHQAPLWLRHRTRGILASPTGCVRFFCLYPNIRRDCAAIKLSQSSAPSQHAN